jgi:hypothetical protein
MKAFGFERTVVVGWAEVGEGYVVVANLVRFPGMLKSTLFFLPVKAGFTVPREPGANPTNVSYNATRGGFLKNGVEA